MTPTVLIGLGGLGSQTVDNIYNMMDDEQKKNTVAAVIDTDVDDLQKLKNINIKIKTSPNITVGKFIDEYQKIKEWFPYVHNSNLKNMMLMDGAGKVRVLSRLSFTQHFKEERSMSLIEL